MDETTVLADIFRGDDAMQRVLGFARHYGPAHVTLAMHAALPLGLTPDLVHLIRNNFIISAPWIAEADLLLSPLCREVGGELYEMIPQAREILLDELKSDSEFGMPRVRELAEFLYEYSVRAGKGTGSYATAEMRDFLKAQEWAALSYLNPEDAARSLALALNEQMQANNQSELVRISRLTQELTAPLLLEENLLLYTTGLEKLIIGEANTARGFFEALGPLDQPTRIGDVQLPSPSSLLPATPVPEPEDEILIERETVVEDEEAAKPGWNEPLAGEAEGRYAPSLSGFGERDWDLLVDRIKHGKYTPLIGPGMTYGMLPLAADIAQQWAQEYNYPFDDTHNLARVARFIGVKYDSMFAKRKMASLISEGMPKGADGLEYTFGFLASLPLPVYITTTYDDLMFEALRQKGKEPRREICRWNGVLQREPSAFDDGFEPDVMNPVVFHLYGNYNMPESLVITEDDHLDFIFNTARQGKDIPPRIQRALTGSTLQMLGYNPLDFSFRVLLQSLRSYMERSLSLKSFVQMLLPPNGYGDRQLNMRRYLDRYLATMSMRVYWGTAQELLLELRERWEFSER